MLIEQPPLLYRMFFPEGIWRINRRERSVYITFDDGPIPQMTPWILDTLDEYKVKGTFFMVGENVWRYPYLFEDIKRRGHSYGNHTYNHLQGIKCTTQTYMENVEKANALIESTLFRPPHGIMRFEQAKRIRRDYSLIMYDLVTRDYDASLSPERVLRNVQRYTRNGSIIVFHDSLRSERNIRYALPRAIEWLRESGYNILPIPML